MVKKSKVLTSEKRNYLSQSDVPSYTLDEALRIPRAIAEQYASKPVSPLRLASALKLTPSASHFKMLCGAAVAYGLTKGSYKAQEISLEALGKRIVRPLKEGDDLSAKREATLKPHVLSEFIQRYSGSPLPRQEIAINVLVDMGVPHEKVKSVYKLILDSAQNVGFIHEIKGKQYIELEGFSPVNKKETENEKRVARMEREASLRLIKPTQNNRRNRLLLQSIGVYILRMGRTSL